MSARVRAQIKKYASRDKVPNLGIVAGVSLLSNGSFRMDDLWAATVNEGDALLPVPGAEDGIAAYLWLLSVEVKLRETHLAQPAASLAFTRHEAQS